MAYCLHRKEGWTRSRRIFGVMESCPLTLSSIKKFRKVVEKITCFNPANLVGGKNEVSNTWYADYFDFGYKFPFLAFLFLSFFLNLRSHVHSEKMDFDIGAARSHWCWCVYIFPLLKPDFFQSFLRPLFYLLQESKFLFPFNFPALFFLP